MDPSVALVTCEQAVRQLMTTTYPQAFGKNWLAHVSKPGSIEKWEGRHTEEEEAKRAKRGVISVDDSLLAYAEFYELFDIAWKYWDPLQPALGKRAETGALLKRFGDLRNTVAHSRALLEFEADLLAGIAGEIRNRVTIYMSTRDPLDNYYPRIESVVDSFGNISPDSSGLSSSLETGLTLNMGDLVTFMCRGIDPQGRELEWWLDNWYTNNLLDEARGDDVRLSWTVSENEVGPRAMVRISMKASGAKYLRDFTRDGSRLFGYRVLPPDMPTPPE
ncbi:hypothetical protein [Kribbella sp. NPDC051718]|uniref:hypothetical protein n=1 Tax=Kribbella sp. NPDC051718 TaxID=3155168 RepID=UPI003430F089